MSEHPLVVLADAVLGLGGAGMELAERPYGRGAFLRVWLPDDASTYTVRRLAVEAGLHPEPAVGHLAHIAATTYDGYQVVIPVPGAMLSSVRVAIAQARELAPEPRELNP